ncbi:hypothetical protein PR202_gb23583 [Eleusine coracana subsp. coracana]|uniref:Uncharacterized protein n=1 Tax=Eleusine coracana subsp. coracana TaxID=191504 RepID=A0AAV5FJB3_ELECO|nr:hypothetical protein PR202_gb23583 [Eleusine coracana subsp. coracana]
MLSEPTPFGICCCFVRSFPCCDAAVPSLRKAAAARCDGVHVDFVCEVADDATVLAGVEVELPRASRGGASDRVFFWGSSANAAMLPYEQAAFQPVAFLQSLYGFVVLDYNYPGLVYYSNLAGSALALLDMFLSFKALLPRRLSLRRLSRGVLDRRISNFREPVVPVVLMNLLQGFVVVRASRRWEYRGGRDDGELRHIDLVLLDSEGFPMYGEVGPDALIHQGPMLLEGKVYKLRRFRVVPARNSYRAVDSQYMIDITVHSLIEEVVPAPQDFPSYTYRLTAFSRVLSVPRETPRFWVFDKIELEGKAVKEIPSSKFLFAARRDALVIVSSSVPWRVTFTSPGTCNRDCCFSSPGTNLSKASTIALDVMLALIPCFLQRCWSSRWERYHLSPKHGQALTPHYCLVVLKVTDLGARFGRLDHHLSAMAGQCVALLLFVDNLRLANLVLVSAASNDLHRCKGSGTINFHVIGLVIEVGALEAVHLQNQAAATIRRSIIRAFEFNGRGQHVVDLQVPFTNPRPLEEISTNSQKDVRRTQRPVYQLLHQFLEASNHANHSSTDHTIMIPVIIPNTMMLQHLFTKSELPPAIYREYNQEDGRVVAACTFYSSAKLADNTISETVYGAPATTIHAAHESAALRSLEYMDSHFHLQLVDYNYEAKENATENMRSYINKDKRLRTAMVEAYNLWREALLRFASVLAAIQNYVAAPFPPDCPHELVPRLHPFVEDIQEHLQGIRARANNVLEMYKYLADVTAKIYSCTV